MKKMLAAEKRSMDGRMAGFTLLEMLLVVMVLGAVAWMSVESVGGNMAQVRYDDTKQRRHAIRRAIIGDTSRTLNGEPVISGFVADMGRLPNNLVELVMQDYCDGSPWEQESTCTGTWVTQKAPATDGSGWHGPYLAPESLSHTGTSYPGFPDGWGNSSTAAIMNFGWSYSNTDNAVTLQSLGMDNQTGVTTLAEDEDNYSYEQDYPVDSSEKLISTNQWQVDGLTISVDIRRAAGESSDTTGEEGSDTGDSETDTGSSSSETDTLYKAGNVTYYLYLMKRNTTYASGDTGTFIEVSAQVAWAEKEQRRTGVIFSLSEALPMGEYRFVLKNTDEDPASADEFSRSFKVLPQSAAPHLSYTEVTEDTSIDDSSSDP